MARFQIIIKFVLCLSVGCLPTCDNSKSEPDRTLDMSGGWDYEHYLSAVEEVAQTLFNKATDKYGKKSTPLFLSLLDLETQAPLFKNPAPTAAPDAIRTTQPNPFSSNLYYDSATLQTFYKLSEITENQKYQQAANEYLQFFFEHCVSDSTGLLAYGQRMFYNVVQDTIVQHLHQLETAIPLLPEMWRVAPQVMQRYTDALYEHHFYDKNNFKFHHSADYYTGSLATSEHPVMRIQDSGLFANIFVYAALQTHNTQYLNWARRLTLLFWDISSPQTGLVPDRVPDKNSTTSSLMALQALYLLNASRMLNDDFIFYVGMAYLNNFFQCAYNPADQTFFHEFNPADGTPVSTQRQPIWEDYAPAIITARACALAFQISQDKLFLDRALKYASYIRNTPPTETTPPGHIGHAIHFFLEIYQTNKSIVFLNEARELAHYALKHYFQNGLIKANPTATVYDARSGAGELLLALLNLYAIESEINFHWKVPAVVQPGKTTIPIEIKMRESTALELNYAFGTDTTQTLILTDLKKSHLKVEIPVPDPEFEGILYYYFYDPERKIEGESGQVLIDDDVTGPLFSDWKIHSNITSEKTASIQVKITDPKGIRQAILKYQSESPPQMLEPDSTANDFYYFTLTFPENASSDSLWFQIEAEDNDNIPAKSQSEKKWILFD